MKPILTRLFVVCALTSANLALAEKILPIPIEPGTKSTKKNTAKGYFDSDGVLRTENGNLLRLTINQALRVCPSHSHLATARELAAIATHKGAQMTDQDPHRAAYERIEGTLESGQKDFFFYDNDRYRDDGSQSAPFWSSTRASGKNAFFYMFDRGRFSIGYSARLESTLIGTNAVMCISNDRKVEPYIPPVPVKVMKYLVSTMPVV